MTVRRFVGVLLCCLGVHPYPCSQGAVGYCTRGRGDLKRTDHGAWYVEGLPPKGERRA